jgi:hypothetical protein
VVGVLGCVVVVASDPCLIIYLFLVFIKFFLVLGV